MADLDPKAAEMFAAGKSVNAVATTLYKGYWARATKQHDAWLAAGGGEVTGESEPRRKPGKKRAAKKAVEPEAESPESSPEIYGLTVEVPDGRLVDLFRTFTAGEQAYAVQAVWQQRVDEQLVAME